MPPELLNLARISAFTAVLWVPYVCNRALLGGVLHEMGYPHPITVLSPWAARLRTAHANAIENLAVFAPLVLIAHAVGVTNSTTVAASAAFLWARVAHAAAYTFRVPVIRTLAFCVGAGCQIAFAWVLLSR